MYILLYGFVFSHLFTVHLAPCLCCFFCFVYCVYLTIMYIYYSDDGMDLIYFNALILFLTWPIAWNRFEEAANTKECSFKEDPSSRWMTTSRSVSESFSALFCSDNWRLLSFSERASDSMFG